MIVLPTQRDTVALGKSFTESLACKGKETIYLTGEIGMGKTTFARAFIEELTGEVYIPSPTYTLVQYYNTPHGRLYHMDFYRIRTYTEVESLGLLDSTDNEKDSIIYIIEWPEMIPPTLLLPRWTVHFMLDNNNGRKADIWYQRV